MSEVREFAMTLTFDERQLLVDVLSDAIDHHATSRERFNAMVQLRARINGSLDD